MYSRILVPTDFSTPSEAALAHARILARTFGASIRLLHVVEDQLVTGPFGAELYVPHTAGTLTKMIDDSRTRLEQSLTDDDRLRFHATGEVIVGTGARTIVEYAADNGFDLIVMGTHGRSGVAHLVMGSVAEHVVRSAMCPVLTVRQGPVPAGVPVGACRVPATA